jgi:hypothetical protein
MNRSVSGRNIHKASGTRSFLDLARHPMGLLGNGGPRPAEDASCLRRGVPVLVTEFLREQGPYRLGRLVFRVAGPDPIVWERYRFLLGHKAARSLSPTFEIGRAGPGRSLAEGRGM